jgi:Uncharacterized protein conserved in bacteria (DUF2064)
MAGRSSPCVLVISLLSVKARGLFPNLRVLARSPFGSKTPRNGFSKTRLSPPLSSEEGASISRCFLRDTCASIETLSQEDPFVEGVVIYPPVGSEADFQQILPSAFRMIAQREGGFGVRLSGATEDLFSIGFSAVCLIDSDSPTSRKSFRRNEIGGCAHIHIKIGVVNIVKSPEQWDHVISPMLRPVCIIHE